MHDPQKNVHDVHDPITKLLRCDNFEYSSTDVTLSPSCLSVLSEHVASQSKMAECRFRPAKTSEQVEKYVVSAIPR